MYELSARNNCSRAQLAWKQLALWNHLKLFKVITKSLLESHMPMWFKTWNKIQEKINWEHLKPSKTWKIFLQNMQKVFNQSLYCVFFFSKEGLGRSFESWVLGRGAYSKFNLRALIWVIHDQYRMKIQFDFVNNVHLHEGTSYTKRGALSSKYCTDIKHNE